jgi:transcriptional regulator with XRE-family HTH domain
METRKEYLERVFYDARLLGLCKTQKEFAELLGMNPSTISNALKGEDRYLTDSIIRRVQAWELQVLQPRKESTPEPAQPQRPDIVIPAATMDLYTSMAKSIDRLSELVERLTAGQTAAPVQGYTAPKNYQIK